MITDLTYIEYHVAVEQPKLRREHRDQCVFLVADAERVLRERIVERDRAEELLSGLVVNTKTGD